MFQFHPTPPRDELIEYSVLGQIPRQQLSRSTMLCIRGKAIPFPPNPTIGEGRLRGRPLSPLGAVSPFLSLRWASFLSTQVRISASFHTSLLCVQAGRWGIRTGEIRAS